MKINIDKDLLVTKLQLSSKFTSSRLVSSTVLQGVLIEGTTEAIHFYSTNLSAYFHTQVDHKHEGTFKLVVEPKKILEFLHFFKPGDLQLVIKENEIQISQGRTRGAFPIIIAEDYPPFPKMEGDDQGIDSKFFEQQLPLVVFSASVDDSRPALTGVNVVKSDDSLVLVSTDGFRLSLVKIKGNISLPSVIIPASFLVEISRSVRSGELVKFSYSSEEKAVRFKTKDGDFISRLIEGDFPPFERIIQNESSTTVTIDREGFLRGIRLISVFARDYSHIVVCEFRKDGLHMRPKKEASGENETFQEIEIKGEDQVVAFNYKFIQDFLNSVKSKTIKIEILRPEAPVTFKLSDQEEFLHIIMPVRLQE